MLAIDQLKNVLDRNREDGLYLCPVCSTPGLRIGQLPDGTLLAKCPGRRYSGRVCRFAKIMEEASLRYVEWGHDPAKVRERLERSVAEGCRHWRLDNRSPEFLAQYPAMIARYERNLRGIGVA